MTTSTEDLFLFKYWWAYQIHKLFKGESFDKFKAFFLEYGFYTKVYYPGFHYSFHNYEDVKLDGDLRIVSYYLGGDWSWDVTPKEWIQLVELFESNKTYEKEKNNTQSSDANILVPARAMQEDQGKNLRSAKH